MDARTLLAAVQQYLQDQLAEFLPHQPSGMARAEILIHMPDGQTNKLTGYLTLPVLISGVQRPATVAQEAPPARVQQSAPRVTVEFPSASEEEIPDLDEDTEADRAKSRCPRDILNALDEAKGPLTLSKLLATMIKKGHEWSHRHVQAWLQSLMRDGFVVHIKDGKRRGYCVPEWVEAPDPDE